MMKVHIRGCNLARTILSCVVLLLMISPLLYSQVSVKVKDVAYVDGLKENQVYGYGLVVGLSGTGDSKVDLTKSSLSNVLKNMGLDQSDIVSSKNVAAVLVTANLPEIVSVGDRIDVSVSSIGDAKSIEGGILIQSALKGADGVTYVVAQGRVSAMQVQGVNRRNQIKTTALVSGGGVVERALESTFVSSVDNVRVVALVLRNFDFALADDISKKIAEKYAGSEPSIGQNGKISMKIPGETPMSEFIAGVLDLEVTPDYGARVVINEKEGTIVIGGDIKISDSVVSREGLTVTIDGETRKVGAAELKESTTVKDVVDALNYAGLSSSDIISVLKALQDAGSLHAEIICK